MATNGKPTTRFVVSYGNLDANTAEQLLAPVFIAPRYDIHRLADGFADARLRVVDSEGNEVTLADGSQTVFDVYGAEGEALNKLATGQKLPWPAQNPDGVVDLTSVSMSAQNPLLAITKDFCTASVSTDAANMVELKDINVQEFPAVTAMVKGADGSTVEKYVDGSISAELRGIAPVVGDTVVVRSGEGDSATYQYATIIDIEPTYATSPAVTVVDAVDNTASTKLIADATAFSATTTASYLVVIKKVPVEGEAGSVVITALAGESSAVLGEFDINAGAAISVGSHGLTIQLSADASVTASDSFIVTCTPPPVVGYNKLQLDAVIDAGKGAEVGVQLATQRLTADVVELDATGWSGNEGGVTLSGELTVAINEALRLEVLQTPLYMNYRELIATNAMTVVSSATTNVADYVGIAHPDNPLGMMYACASRVDGAFFYLLATRDNSDEAYIDAISYAAKFENLYAFVPYKQSATLRSAVLAEISRYSTPEVAQYKRVWFAPLTQREKRIFPENTETSTILGSVDATGKLKLMLSDSENNAVTAGIRKGDVVRLYVGYSAGSSSWQTKDLTVVRVVDADEVYVDSAVPQSMCRVEFIRTLSARAYAEALAGEASSINTERATFVACDLLTWDDTYTDVDKIYAAATLAAMRSALPPHAPMNELTVPGFTVTDTLGWSDLDYEIMNDGGVWLIYNDADGVSRNYHQITTLTDGTIAEEDSAVSNGDSIVRALRTALRTRGIGGRANVSDTLLSQIRNTIIAELNYIQGIPYSDLYGSRILTHNIESLYVPASNRQSIVCRVRVQLPLPLQDGLFEFNLV